MGGIQICEDNIPDTAELIIQILKLQKKVPDTLGQTCSWIDTWTQIDLYLHIVTATKLLYRVQQGGWHFGVHCVRSQALQELVSPSS